MYTGHMVALHACEISSAGTTPTFQTVHPTMHDKCKQTPATLNTVVDNFQYSVFQINRSSGSSCCWSELEVLTGRAVKILDGNTLTS